ncbi:MAG: class I SAM-dependent methyltransferase [Bdellovibrionales bacterium]|nr:class I SAM-dependent methyltransferase [Bdellovibrionales bacterium]NQZ20118.1 class I SAM-dependent methyltransferase [Bdellovibrionales bacterium]
MEKSELKTDQLQQLYRESSEKVRKIDLKKEEAEKHYRNYFNFVTSFVSSGKLLDIGCGSGWSSYLFAQHGFETTGVDLHSNGFDHETSEKLKFQTEDAQNLSFNDESFDVVCTNECLEHVPDPQKALSEMTRVLKPGGYLVIIGPNLLSLGMSVKAITKYVWQQRPISRVVYRDTDLPFHPLGNTLPEIFYFFGRNLFLIPFKSMAKNPSFKMRTPDLRPPFHADSDSCYLLNPIDLQKFFNNKSDFSIKQSGAIGRPKSLELVASGTWFCAQKKM